MTAAEVANHRIERLRFESAAGKAPGAELAEELNVACAYKLLVIRTGGCGG